MRAVLPAFLCKKEVVFIEIKINKEVRKYQENIFFGLSMRQFVCSILAVGLAVLVHFLLKILLGKRAFHGCALRRRPPLPCWDSLNTTA